MLAAMVLAINLVHSRIGRALRSIHQNEEAAHSLGVDTYRYKVSTFVLSALFAAAGGIFLTHYNGSIGPSEVTVMKSVRYVAIVAVGGMANLWGAMLMGVLLNFLSLRGVFGSYDDAVFGAILIVVMLFAPQGLLRIPLWCRLPACIFGLGACRGKSAAKMAAPQNTAPCGPSERLPKRQCATGHAEPRPVLRRTARGAGRQLLRAARGYQGGHRTKRRGQDKRCST